MFYDSTRANLVVVDDTLVSSVPTATSSVDAIRGTTVTLTAAAKDAHAVDRGCSVATIL